MKLCVLLYQITSPKTPLPQLFGSDFELIGIFSPTSITTLTSANEAAFSEVLVSSDFYSTLQTLIAAKKMHYETIYLETIDESCLHIIAKLCAEFNLPGLSENDLSRFTNKILMKQTLAASHIRLPRYQAFDKTCYQREGTAYLNRILTDIPLPIFVKPIDAYGSRNAIRINALVEFITWADTVLADTTRYEIDEFIEGKVLHCDSLNQNGKPVFFAAGEMNLPLAQFAHGYPIGSIPIERHSELFHRLEEFNQKILAVMEPPNGATHLECFLTHQDELIFLEIAARPPGGLVIKTYDHCYGVNFEKAHYYLQMQLPFTITLMATQEYFAWLFIPKPEGNVLSLHTPSGLKSHFDIAWLCERGDLLQKSREITQEHIGGLITLTNSDYPQLYRDFYALTEFPFISVED